MKSHHGLFNLVGIFAIVLIMSSSPVFSQAMRDSSRDFMNIEHLKKQLSLSDEQGAKLQGILETFRKQAREDREKYQGDRETMRKVMQEGMLKLDKDVESLLTPEQLKKYEQMKQERRERMRQRFQERRQQEQKNN